jgi:hypothetical protein
MLSIPRVDSITISAFLEDIMKALFDFLVGTLVWNPTTTFPELPMAASQALRHLWLVLEYRSQTAAIEHCKIREYATSVFLFVK